MNNKIKHSAGEFHLFLEVDTFSDQVIDSDYDNVPCNYNHNEHNFLFYTLISNGIFM